MSAERIKSPFFRLRFQPGLSFLPWKIGFFKCQFDLDITVSLLLSDLASQFGCFNWKQQEVETFDNVVDIVSIGRHHTAFGRNQEIIQRIFFPSEKKRSMSAESLGKKGSLNSDSTFFTYSIWEKVNRQKLEAQNGKWNNLSTSLYLGQSHGFSEASH